MLNRAVSIVLRDADRSTERQPEPVAQRGPVTIEAPRVPLVDA